MSTMSSRDGWPRERRSSAAIRMPGVQKPHWSAWWRLKASWSGESIASPASDSTVSTAEPSACTASRQQTADGDAVEPHRAGAADAVLAADVRAGEAEAVAEEVGQQQPGLDVLDDDLAVDRDRDLRHAARSQARSSARSTSVPVRWRRYAARGMDRARRVDGRSGEQAGLVRRRLRQRGAFDRVLDLGERGRPVGHRADPDPDVAGHAVDRRARPRPSRARSPRPAARAPRTRPPRPAPARPGRLDDELARRERRQVVGDEEVGGRDLPSPARALDDDRAAERGEAERELGRAVGVRDAASDRAAVARHEVADVGQRLAQKRVGAQVVLERRLTDGGADPDDAVRPRSRRDRRG